MKVKFLNGNLAKTKKKSARYIYREPIRFRGLWKTAGLWLFTWTSLGRKKLTKLYSKSKLPVGLYLLCFDGGSDKITDTNYFVEFIDEGRLMCHTQYTKVICRLDKEK